MINLCNAWDCFELGIRSAVSDTVRIIVKATISLVFCLSIRGPREPTNDFVHLALHPFILILHPLILLHYLLHLLLKVADF